MSGEAAIRHGQKKTRQEGSLVLHRNKGCQKSSRDNQEKEPYAAVTARAGAAVTSAAVAGAGRHVEIVRWVVVCSKIGDRLGLLRNGGLADDEQSRLEGRP